jgi:hypothetical protein
MRLCRAAMAMGLLTLVTGCASTKTSDTARTGIEQLLISSATDQALDKVNLQPIAQAKVFLETKYLDCTDKNYVIVALHQRLMRHGCTLVDKPEEAQVIVEVASGAIGTDRQDFFVGIPSVPLAPPSPIALPRMELFTRTRANGTARLTVLAYDAKTRLCVVDSGAALARSDYKSWHMLGTAPVVTGRIPAELAAATGESESPVTTMVAGPKTSKLR